MPKQATAPPRLRTTFPDQSLTAAAARVSSSDAGQYRRLNQAWQLETFGFYRSLGECWYPAQFYAHALPNVRFYAGIRDQQGNVTELDETDWASEQLNRIQDPGGGRSQLMEAYGRLQFLIGDCYLIGTMDGEEEGWEFLSSCELRALPGGAGSNTQYARVAYPGATPEELQSLDDDAYEPLPSGVVVYRFWNRDPEYSLLADSPCRAVLPLYRQLALLEAAVTARAQSRICNAQVLLVADELDFGPADGQNEDNPQTDPFSQRLTETFIRPIKTPGAASAVAPPIIRVPSEMIEKDAAMRIVRIHNPEETYQETQIRDEIRNRIAIGLDFPPEEMLGLGDANHWSGWNIDENAWNAHLKPVTVRFCDDLGRAFLRPLARQEGKEYSDGQLVVWFDESAVVNHPDRMTDAKELFDLGVLSGDKVREVGGFTDDDAQTPEEHREWLFVKTGHTDVQEPAPAVPGDTPVTDSNVEKLPPKETEGEQTALQDEDSSVTSSAFAEQAVGAAEMAVVRCRALAGSKLRGKTSEHRDVPNSLLAAALGELEQEHGILVRGGSEEYVGWLLASGVDSGLAARIGKLVEQHAAHSLCSPEGLPAATVAFVRKSLGGLAQAA